MPSHEVGAMTSYEQRTGVCRDFRAPGADLLPLHDIPARYCTGYLGDIGVPPDPAPMVFSPAGSRLSLGEW